MTILVECPECAQGKHINCTGTALTERDQWVDCACANRDHLTVNQFVERQTAIRVAEQNRVLRSEQAVLPYAGTSGYSGSDTSEERARTEDSDGTTARRQIRTRMLLEHRGHEGLTVSELRDMTGWHHGNASAALSVLHKVGLIERLSERRERCKVYVLPQYVDDRETEQHGRKTPVRTPAQQEARDRLRRYLRFRAANMNANSVRTTYEQATMLGDLAELLEEQ